MKTREEVVSNISSRFILLKQNGEEVPIDVNSFDKQEEFQKEYPELVKLINFEILGKKPGVVPPSVKIMRNMELVDYEPASDAGHFRFYPKGALMLKLLEDWAEEVAINRFGAMQIETPILYDWNHKAIRSQGESFHERHYTVHVPYHKEKEFVLRFAGDFGLFCMVSDANISHRHLPLRIYEFSKSYRYEQSGALVGLRRLRGFSMPDIHSFCSDIDQSWEEYKELYRNYSDLADAAKVEYAVIFRVVEQYYKKYKDQILTMLQYSGKPGIIEVLSDMKHYWAVKHEFQGIDSVGGACQVATVQLDVKDAERYGITFTGEDNKEHGCVICHSSIGALERWLYLVLEASQKTDVPEFPLWLAPTQVRLIPVSDKYIDYALSIAMDFRKNRVRADVDDRPESVGKRVRIAAKDWVPYTLVVGQDEMDSGGLSVKKRGERKSSTMGVSELVEIIHKFTENMPFRQSTLPVLMSKIPVFFG